MRGAEESSMELECQCRQRLLTVADVSAWLAVSRDWIYDEVEADRFPVVRLGRQLRFRLADVQDYLDGRWTPTSIRALEPHVRAPRR